MRGAEYVARLGGERNEHRKRINPKGGRLRNCSPRLYGHGKMGLKEVRCDKSGLDITFVVRDEER